jgi:hypothetical protein
MNDQMPRLRVIDAMRACMAELAIYSRHARETADSLMCLVPGEQFAPRVVRDVHHTVHTTCEDASRRLMKGIATLEDLYSVPMTDGSPLTQVNGGPGWMLDIAKRYGLDVEEPRLREVLTLIGAECEREHARLRRLHRNDMERLSKEDSCSA